MKQEVFVKHHSTGFQDYLIVEAESLELLRNALINQNNSYLAIPEIISVSEHCLEMKHIQTCTPSKVHFENLAKGLALLHKEKQKYFGFAQDNYIGLNPQKNIIADNWGNFFIQSRLSFQVDLIQSKVVQQKFQNILETVNNKLEDFLNQSCEIPSLVHGDLWSGNVLYSEANKVWLIDPALYFGDREVDIAMTEMFGGFTQTFYQSYCECLPLSDEYTTKRIIYNLYHYLNHYNLFGASYLAACEQGFEFLKKEFA